MLEQYWLLKNEVPNALLLYRLGDFYEMFFEDAEKAAPLLGLVLTKRHRDSDIEAPMCGIPYHAAESYIAKLVSAGERVAIAEQVEAPAKGKPLVARKIIRVITPGTTVDLERMDARRNNEVAGLLRLGPEEAMAFLDVSTGEFSVVKMGEPGFAEVLRRRTPRELIVFSGDEPAVRSCLQDLQPEPPLLVTAPPDTPRGHAARDILLRHFQSETLSPFGLEGLEAATGAAAMVLHYARSMQRSGLPHVVSLRTETLDDGLVVDSVTAQHLEVFRSIRDGARNGTLLSVLDTTETAFGSRALRRMLERPLGRKGQIDDRLDAVEELMSDGPRLERLAQGLRGLPDFSRLIGRLASGTGSPRDLQGLGNGLLRAAEIEPLLEGVTTVLLAGPGEASPRGVPVPLAQLILSRLVEEPPLGSKDGGVFRDGVDQAVDELRALRRESASILAALEAEERSARGVSGLKVRFNQVFGHVFEVPAAARPKIPETAVKRQTLANVERYATAALVEIDEKLRTADSRLAEREAELFEELRESVLLKSSSVFETWSRLGNLDALVSLARVARSKGWTRPRIADDPVLIIKDGRHPVVETTRPREPFIPNDTSLGPETRLVVLTGPNMGGKSTYLRQNALIVLLAHMGSFVPASEATVGLCDRIFTRVGASDSLARGESTFFVEMSESAHILRQATSRSVVVLDEIGRGTSTFDGLSLAWAIAERLHDGEGKGRDGPARVLFATHYHELTEIALVKSAVRNRTMAVKEWQNEVVFLRKVIEGTADRSYGVQVARLAGIPEPVLVRAREILHNLERQQLDFGGKPRLAEHAEAPQQQEVQLDLFHEQSDVVLDAIARLDIDRTTPLVALNLLAAFQRRLRGES